MFEGSNPANGFPQFVALGPSEEIVVITGGSGFLGQHIIRVLNERSAGIKEIRVVDIVPYHKKLDFEEIYPVKFYFANIAMEDDLNEPFSDATSVIHAATVVNVDHYIDKPKMRSVNIIGTRNIICKCRQWNIEKLIFTSTVDAVFLINSHFINEIESNTELPTNENEVLMGYYGFSKAQAEAYVFCAGNSPLPNGRNLKVVILRATAMFGELDPYYVTSALKVAKSFGGYLYKPLISNNNQPILQSTYAGNVAWAHILSLYWLGQKTLRQKTTKPIQQSSLQLDGETIFITDDTHPTSLYNFMLPFLNLRGFKLVQLPIPYPILQIIVKTGNWFIKNLFTESWKKWLIYNPILPTYSGFKMAHSTVTVSREKAEKLLQYKPIYSEEQAKQQCSTYYKELIL